MLHAREDTSIKRTELSAPCIGGEWTREGQALVAQVERRGTTIYLIKPLTPVNATGPVLVPLAQRLGVEPPTCVLVHDDADLALGAVRGRLKGSDGGHRGVRSILEAFRTDAIPRVKIGVGRPRQQEQLAGYGRGGEAVGSHVTLAEGMHARARRPLG